MTETNLWAIAAGPFETAAAIRGQQTAGPADATARPGVAVVRIVGPVSKYGSWWFDTMTTDSIRKQLQAAVDSPDASSVLLLIDSPGGTVAGAYDLADAISAAGRRKPVVAFIEDTGASAAYLWASQAHAVYANRNALVGSIGTYGVLRDTSKLADSVGVKVHVIRAGEFKGLGVPGTEITPEQLAEVQRVVNSENELFIQAVAKGRRMKTDRVRELADGRVYVGEEAVAVGLIDGVASLDYVLANTYSISKGRKMSATLKELKQALPSADSDFLLSQLEAEATIEQAAVAWAQHLASQNTQLAEENQRLKTSPKGSVGVDPVPDAGRMHRSGGSAVADFEEAVKAVMEERQVDRRTAHSIVCHADPDLRRAVVVEANQRAGRGEAAQALIDGRV